MKKNKAAAILGKLGGNKTLALYGKDHFSKIGKRAMKSRWSKVKLSTVPLLTDNQPLDIIKT